MRLPQRFRAQGESFQHPNKAMALQPLGKKKKNDEMMPTRLPQTCGRARRDGDDVPEIPLLQGGLGGA